MISQILDINCATFFLKYGMLYINSYMARSIEFNSSLVKS